MEVSEAEVQKALQALDQKKTAYQIVFSSEGAAGQAVLLDLDRFCRGQESCWHPDPRQHAMLEGRREVWLRIQSYLTKPVEELLQQIVRDKYTVVKVQPEDTE